MARPHARPIDWWRWFRVYAVALFWVVVIEVGLRTRGLPALASALDVMLDSTDSDRTPPPEAVEEDFTQNEWTRIHVISHVLRRWPFGDTCLRRCLAWGHMLRGHSPRLRIGVARGAAGDILAHSWIEFDEMSLGLDPDIVYLPV